MKYGIDDNTGGDALTEEEEVVLDEVKSVLWEKIGALMEAGGFESAEVFNFKMQTWVQHEALTRPSAVRSVVLLASNQIQARFYLVMSLAAAESASNGDVIGS